MVGNYTAGHYTVYFTEELFAEIQTSSFLQSLPFFFHGGRHVLALSEEQTEKMAALFGLLKQLKDHHAAVPGIVHSMLMLSESFHAGADSQPKNSVTSNKEKITYTFRKLVAEHFSRSIRKWLFMPML